MTPHAPARPHLGDPACAPTGGTPNHLWTHAAPVAMGAAIFLAWLAWALWSAAVLWPAHDEIITLLNMRDNATPVWDTFASVAQHQTFLQAPLARFSDIGPMLRATDVHPPLYYHLALAFSYLTGGSLWDLRLLSIALTATAGVGVLFLARAFLQRARHLWALPLLSACLWSASTVAYAAINARSYSLVFFLATGLAIALFAFVQAPSRKHAWTAAAAMGTTAGLLMWTHYFGIIAAAAALGAALVCGVRNKQAAGAWMAAAAVVGAAGIALLPWLDAHLHAREEQYAGFNGWLIESVAVIRILLEQVSFLSTASWSALILFAIAPFLLMILVKGVLLPSPTHKQGVQAFSMALLCSLALIFAMFWWTDKTLRLSDSSRYGMFVVAFLIPLLAHGARREMIGLVAVTFLAITPWFGGDRIAQPWEWQNAFTDTIKRLDSPQQMVVMSNGDRGVAGNVLYRAQNGWVGFAWSEGDPMEERVSIPQEVTRASFVSFGHTPPPSVWASWESLLQAEGFAPTGPKTWERVVPSPAQGAPLP